MRFREVTIQARDPEAFARWYREALGLAAAPGASAGVLVGETTLRLEPAPAGEEPLYHLAFNIPEDQVEDALRWITPRAALVEHDGGPIVRFESWDAHAVYFLDGEGNILEMIARHTLRNGSAGAFGPASLLNVSEVGLPCPDVPQLAARLARELGIAPYRPGRDTFAPMGDEHGLLILVVDGRQWFPIGRGARPYPVRIVHDGPAYDAPGLPYRFLRA